MPVNDVTCGDTRTNPEAQTVSPSDAAQVGSKRWPMTSAAAASEAAIRPV